MVSKVVKVIDETGLHLRPAGVLCKEAGKYNCKVEFKTKKGTFNAKSILSVLAACVQVNDEIELVCEGDSEEEALEKISKMIENGLGSDFKVNG